MTYTEEDSTGVGVGAEGLGAVFGRGSRWVDLLAAMCRRPAWGWWDVRQVSTRTTDREGVALRPQNHYLKVVPSDEEPSNERAQRSHFQRLVAARIAVDWRLAEQCDVADVLVAAPFGVLSSPSTEAVSAAAHTIAAEGHTPVAGCRQEVQRTQTADHSQADRSTGCSATGSWASAPQSAMQRNRRTNRQLPIPPGCGSCSWQRSNTRSQTLTKSRGTPRNPPLGTEGDPTRCATLYSSSSLEYRLP